MDKTTMETDCSVKSYISSSWIHKDVGDVHHDKKVTAN